MKTAATINAKQLLNENLFKCFGNLRYAGFSCAFTYHCSADEFILDLLSEWYLDNAKSIN